MRRTLAEAGCWPAVKPCQPPDRSRQPGLAPCSAASHGSDEVRPWAGNSITVSLLGGGPEARPQTSKRMRRQVERELAFNNARVRGLLDSGSELTAKRMSAAAVGSVAPTGSGDAFCRRGATGVTVEEKMADGLYPEASGNLAKLRKQLGPEQDAAFKAFGKAVFAPGALDAKTKQLIAVAVAHATQCPYCIRGHTKAALKAGATRAEIMEAVWVTAEMRAGAAFAHSLLALDEVAKAEAAPAPEGERS